MHYKLDIHLILEVIGNRRDRHTCIFVLRNNCAEAHKEFPVTIQSSLVDQPSFTCNFLPPNQVSSLETQCPCPHEQVQSLSILLCREVSMLPGTQSLLHIFLSCRAVA